MDKHREGIKSNRPCGENQNHSSVKITIKTHEQNYNNNTRGQKYCLQEVQDFGGSLATLCYPWAFVDQVLI